MFGVEPIEILLFFRQFAIAIAGAVSFWGAVFLYISKRSPARLSALWRGAAQKLLWVFFPALFFYGGISLLLFISQCLFCANAHEGIALAPPSGESLGIILQNQYPLFIAILLFGLGGIFTLAFPKTHQFFLKNLWGYGIFFAAISVLLMYPWQGNMPPAHAVSSALHNWHSILTLGSVVVIDYIFIAFRANLFEILPRVFGLITKGIWIGLGLDFISAGLIFDEVFSVSDRLLFMQTIVGVVIINGVILSGPLARSFLSLKHRNMPMSKTLHKTIGISGAISFAGWTSITAVDGFRNITLSYPTLLLAYAALVICVFIARQLIERLLSKVNTAS